ncbi:MAG: ABC transporter substrate-binding protein [Acetobacteraceae bacterium]
MEQGAAVPRRHRVLPRPALLAGDVVGAAGPSRGLRAGDRPRHDQAGEGNAGMQSAEYYQADVQGVWVNNKHKPYDDPRVRRALHLVLDRPVLVEVVKDIGFMMVGGFIYPFSEFATPSAELSKRPGYQADPAAAIKEARALMAAAGYANGLKGQDLLIRDFSSLKLWAQALQAILQETLTSR